MNDLSTILSEPIAAARRHHVTLGQALAFGALLFRRAVPGAGRLRCGGRPRRARSRPPRPPTHARDAEARMAGILQAQAEMQGRIGAMAEVFGARQAELNQSIGQRLDAMTGRHRPDHDRADQIDA